MQNETETNTQAFQHLVKISTRSELSFPGFQNCALAHLMEINAFGQLTFNNIARLESLDCPMVDSRLFFISFSFENFFHIKPKTQRSSEIILGLVKWLGEIPRTSIQL